METYFAPAHKADRTVLKSQIHAISQSPVINAILDITSSLLVILNEHRQVLALNASFMKAAGITDPEKALGMRLGETLSCVHARELPNGCGTTPHCITCGAAIAMVTAINENRTHEEICALSSDREGATNDLSLLIKAQPISVEGFRWILVFAQDITQQQFWANLERVFFHDISNILSSLYGNISFLADDLPDNPEVKQILYATERLQNELAFQKSLCQHKEVQYLLKKTKISMADIKREFNLVISGHQSSKHKTVIQSWPDEDFPLYTDALLVSRILGNMAINALEATSENGFIKVTATVMSGKISWDIWSDSFIPEDTQLRIFQRHFSTKATVGRGLGTYSMKLFGENYLKGSVSFSSGRKNGTTFTFSLPY